MKVMIGDAFAPLSAPAARPPRVPGPAQLRILSGAHAVWGLEDWAMGVGWERVAVDRDHRGDHPGPFGRALRAHVVRCGVGLACAFSAHQILTVAHLALSCGYGEFPTPYPSGKAVEGAWAGARAHFAMQCRICGRVGGARGMAASRQGARARQHAASLAGPERQPMCARAAPRAKGWAVARCGVQAVCKLSA